MMMTLDWPQSNQSHIWVQVTRLDRLNSELYMYLCNLCLLPMYTDGDRLCLYDTDAVCWMFIFIMRLINIWIAS